MEIIPKTHLASAAITTPFKELYPSKRIAFDFGWDDLTGTINGVVYVEVSNDGVEVVQAGSVNLTASTNLGNRAGLELVTAFHYWRLRYNPGGITGGTFFANYSVRG